jgi:hypothetical protein
MYCCLSQCMMDGQLQSLHCSCIYLHVASVIPRTLLGCPHLTSSVYICLLLNLPFAGVWIIGVNTFRPFTSLCIFSRIICDQQKRSISTTFISIDITLCWDRLCGLVVRVPGYRMEMYCVSCEVRTEFIYLI